MDILQPLNLDNNDIITHVAVVLIDAIAKNKKIIIYDNDNNIIDIEKLQSILLNNHIDVYFIDRKQSNDYTIISATYGTHPMLYDVTNKLKMLEIQGGVSIISNGLNNLEGDPWLGCSKKLFMKILLGGKVIEYSVDEINPSGKIFDKSTLDTLWESPSYGGYFLNQNVLDKMIKMVTYCIDEEKYKDFTNKKLLDNKVTSKIMSKISDDQLSTLNYDSLIDLSISDSMIENIAMANKLDIGVAQSRIIEIIKKTIYDSIPETNSLLIICNNKKLNYLLESIQDDYKCCVIKEISKPININNTMILLYSNIFKRGTDLSSVLLLSSIVECKKKILLDLTTLSDDPEEIIIVS